MNAQGRVPLPGGNVAEPSRLLLDHVQRQDAAASFHEDPVKVEAASSRLPSMPQRPDAASLALGLWPRVFVYFVYFVVPQTPSCGPPACRVAVVACCLG